MSRADLLDSTPRQTAQPRDPQAWRATLAAAQRVMGYYARKAERSDTPRNDAQAASNDWSDLAPASRLAA